MIREPRSDEKIIAQAIHVLENDRTKRFRSVHGHEFPLGPAADRAREMERRGDRRTARQDEVREGREGFLHAVDLIFEEGDFPTCDERDLNFFSSRGREFGAELENLALNPADSID